MKIKPKQYALALFELIKDEKEKNIPARIAEFAATIAKNNQLSQTAKIISFFIDFWNKEKDEIDAEVLTVNGLDKGSFKEIERHIAEKMQVKKVNLTEKQDKNILGGLILKYGDRILDNSVRTRLRGVRAEMLK